MSVPLWVEHTVYRDLGRLDVDLTVQAAVAAADQEVSAGLDVGILGVVDGRLVSVMVVHIADDRRTAEVSLLPDHLVPGLESWQEEMPERPGTDALEAVVGRIESATGERLEHLAVWDWAGATELVEMLGGGIDLNVGSEQKALFWPEALRLLPRSVPEFVDRDVCRAGDDPDLAEALRLQRQQVLLSRMVDLTLHQEFVYDVVDLYGAVDTLVRSVAVDRAWSKSELRSLAFGLRHLRTDSISYVVQTADGVPRRGGDFIGAHAC